MYSLRLLYVFSGTRVIEVECLQRNLQNIHFRLL